MAESSKQEISWPCDKNCLSNCYKVKDEPWSATEKKWSLPKLYCIYFFDYHYFKLVRHLLLRLVLMCIYVMLWHCCWPLLGLGTCASCVPRTYSYNIKNHTCTTSYMWWEGGVNSFRVLIYVRTNDFIYLTVYDTVKETISLFLITWLGKVWICVVGELCGWSDAVLNPGGDRTPTVMQLIYIG